MYSLVDNYGNGERGKEGCRTEGRRGTRRIRVFFMSGLFNLVTHSALTHRDANLNNK